MSECRNWDIGYHTQCSATFADGMCTFVISYSITYAYVCVEQFQRQVYLFPSLSHFLNKYIKIYPTGLGNCFDVSAISQTMPFHYRYIHIWCTKNASTETTCLHPKWCTQFKHSVFKITYMDICTFSLPLHLSSAIPIQICHIP